MTYVDAPTIIGQLRTQLAACATWTTAGKSAADIHYPRFAYDATKTLWAVLAIESRSVSRRFVGVNLPSGTLRILLYSTDTPGDLEEMAQKLGDEVCTETGIEGLTVTAISEAEESDEAQQISHGAVCECVITLNYGLE